MTDSSLSALRRGVPAEGTFLVGKHEPASMPGRQQSLTRSRSSTNVATQAVGSHSPALGCEPMEIEKSRNVAGAETRAVFGCSAGDEDDLCLDVQGGCSGNFAQRFREASVAGRSWFSREND
jgi:hypothetical protein